VTLVIVTALGVGIGLMGVIAGLRVRRPSLETILGHLAGDESLVGGHHLRNHLPLWRPEPWRLDRRMGLRVAQSVRARGVLFHGLESRLALTSSSLEVLCTRCVVSATAASLLPPLTWALMRIGGLRVSVLLPLWVGVLFGVGGALLPVAELNSQAKRARRHAKRVICSFLDLVVLGLAGGMGIESALVTAAQLGENAMSRRMVAALSLCRDTGEPPWEALAGLGRVLGIDELGELAATAGLAGTEGAKVRTTLAARAASMRRHELADAEAEANALTERLFLPGAFLLVGFLVFVGYPAFTRIASGF
jgi:tight adherence protein C